MNRNSLRNMSLINILSLLFVLCIGVLHAQDKAARIDEFVSAVHSHGTFNGSVLVAEKGKIIFTKGYGLANIEWNIPNTPDTKFRIGSITKQFTSMIILQLVVECKLSLEDQLSDCLPGYRKDTGDKVTVHHLLTHTSGIPSYTNMPEFFPDISRDPYDVNEFVEKYCSGDLEFEPGSRYRYNNSGYFLLGAIIEKVTGKTYEQALEERILKPLGMESTGYDRHAPIITKRATGYNITLDGYENSEYLDMGLPFAAGAMYATVEDMVLWDRALYTNELLPKKYRDMLFQNHIESIGGRYGYGWGMGEITFEEIDRRVPWVAHSGGINGFNTNIFRLIEDKHLIVIFNNTPGANLSDMNNAIVHILYDQPYEIPKKPLSQILYKTIKAKGSKEAIEQYHALKEKDPNGYDFRENTLNIFGYRLLRVKMIEEAVAIFKLNAEMFPESSNVYDSLADGYKEMGEKKLAIKNYAKAIELNPDARESNRKLNALIEETE